MAYPRQSIELSSRELLQLTQTFFRSPTDSRETVRRFESAFANFVGVREAVGFASQRAGMYAILKTLDRREGDEVIVPAYTFFSVPACVLLAGLTPVFVDVDLHTWNLDPSWVKSAITKHTRAIIVTHLNGCPAELESLVRIARESNIPLIEDCAQALGATYQSKPVGSFGVGCFSFGEGKNLLAMGGGMITTNDSGLAARLRQALASYRAPSLSCLLMKLTRLLALKTLTYPSVFTFTAFPWIYLSSFKNGKVDSDKEHRLELISRTSLEERLSNAQASLGLAQLDALEARNQRRRENARWLSEMLRGMPEIELPPEFSERVHLYLHYAVRVKDREKFVRRLIRRGVDAQRDYCSFCPNLPDFQQDRSRSPFETPVAKNLGESVTYLPTQPQLGKSDMLRIAHAVTKVLTS